MINNNLCYKLFGLILLMSLVVPTLTMATPDNTDMVSDVIDTPENTSTVETAFENKGDVREINTQPTVPTKDSKGSTLAVEPENMDRPLSPRSQRDLPDPVKTLANETWGNGTIMQNEFITYSFSFPTQDQLVYIECEFEGLAADWMDIYVDDADEYVVAADNDANADEVAVIDEVLPNGTYTIVLFGSNVQNQVADDMVYNVTLWILAVPPAPPKDGLTYEGALDWDFNTTIDFQLTQNSLVWDYLLVVGI